MVVTKLFFPGTEKNQPLQRCKSFDTDGDGFISLEFLHDFFDSYNKIHTLVKYVDSDGDGLIDLKECISIMNTIGFRLPDLKNKI